MGGRGVEVCNGQSGNGYRVGWANGGVHGEVCEVVGGGVPGVEDGWVGRDEVWAVDLRERVRAGGVAHEDVRWEGVEVHGVWVDERVVRGELVG